MTIKQILVIGNRDLSYAIVGALLPPLSHGGDPSPIITVLTNPFQTPYLPPHVPKDKVQHKTTDFTPPSLHSAFVGQDLVICTIAGADYDFQMRIIDAAVAAGVKRFMPHEFGQDSLNIRIQGRTPRTVGRASVIEYLRRLSDNPRSAFTWVAVAVGCILDTALMNGDLGFDLQWQSGALSGTGNERFAATSLARVGLVVARIVGHWDDVENQFLYSAGLFTSAKEVTIFLEKLTASTWTVDYSEIGDCIREGTSRIERGYPDAGMRLLEKSILCDESLRTIDAFEHGSANGLLQLEAESIKAILDRTYHDFQHRGKPKCGCE
ncbi:hypothetical protein K491DRAFT_708210 [Lophiostoma macrostomum CBS 122681]|uniref:NmrA-like domain-containing protein n=1 Tax=Lophiostoma macrostomum CBS 122681 TaxID=1314788 RepID=A0A6A6SQT7_9PLEO|nr:hypothetical protein K491DRAFT_708210 [Lophiostoma macrostomum CBS 122681]